MSILKNNNSNQFSIQPYRRIVQFGFLALTLWIGIEFIIFVHQLENGTLPTIARPAGVEAFLPISALISFKYWILTGNFNTIHPSALVLLLIFVAMAIILKKGFCAWVCPVGLFSEYLEKIHIFIFDKPKSLPRWLDYPLRSLKYLLLLFFAWAIFVQMDVLQLEKFIYSPYNKVADIKMLKFFSEMSAMTARVLVGLVLLTILVRHFWCRYLCPYGALLGSLSWLSLFKIHRNQSSCTDCEKCTQVCPSRIRVHKEGAVFSDECHACLKCIDACPVKDTLYLSIAKEKGTLPRMAYPIILVALFLIGIITARVTGYWQNEITVQEYRYHVQHFNEPVYNHNRGQVPEYENNAKFNDKPNNLNE